MLHLAFDRTGTEKAEPLGILQHIDKGRIGRRVAPAIDAITTLDTFGAWALALVQRPTSRRAG